VADVVIDLGLSVPDGSHDSQASTDDQANCAAGQQEDRAEGDDEILGS